MWNLEVLLPSCLRTALMISWKPHTLSSLWPSCTVLQCGGVLAAAGCSRLDQASRNTIPRVVPVRAAGGVGIRGRLTSNGSNAAAIDARTHPDAQGNSVPQRPGFALPKPHTGTW